MSSKNNELGDKKFDIDEGWTFAKETKFTKMVTETRFDRQKFKETKRREEIERQRKQFSDEDLEEMERRSLIDPITNLNNQRSFLRKLEYELRRAKRYKRPLSIMLISIDNMAQLQRQYGQMIVEEVLKAAGRIIEGSVRDVDIAGMCAHNRLGVIFPETYSSRAMVVAERVRERIKQEPINTELRHLRVSTSIGVVSFPTHARDEIDLMDRAVEFASKAEAEGGDRVHNG